MSRILFVKRVNIWGKHIHSLRWEKVTPFQDFQTSKTKDFYFVRADIDVNYSMPRVLNPVTIR